MADCHDLFQSYHEKIVLLPSKKDNLRSSRNKLRDKIKKYFKEELKANPPLFWGQGSYAMGTIVNPLNGEYDIDDGVYLQNLDKDNKDSWPTPETAHRWICKAVEGHTKEKPIDKKPCVRVVYSGQYHVDLPIYGGYKGAFYLAEKGEKSWHISDPRALTEWFKKQVKQSDGQLRRIVRYLKAWADYKSKTNNVKLPRGLILTVLVAENYVEKERDDSAFGRTIRNIYQKIIDSFVVYNPVDQDEILTERLTDPQKKKFKELLVSLLNNANKALDEKSKKEACRIWRREFGDRFPCCDDIKEEESPLYTSSPAILRDDARSA